MRYRVFATAETPFAISVRRATGNDLDTQRFIPGTVIRGALAAAYLAEHNEPDAAFHALFLQKLVRFGDLRIGDARPWPLSVRQCAAKPDEHPKIDNLLRAGAEGVLPIECQDPEENPEDRPKLEPPQGYYRFKQPDPSRVLQYCGEEVGSRRLAHAEIDPLFLKARPGQFHSSQLVDQAQEFSGFFHARDEGEAALLSLIGKGRDVYVGRGRSRGQGRVRVSIFEEAARSPSRIRDKIERMNQVARRLGGQNDSVVFSCTLDSATVLYDRWLRPRSCLEARDLGLAPAANEEPYEIVAQFQRTAPITGWHAKGGLPKSETVAVSPGSCFLFRRHRCADPEVEYQRLAVIFAGLEECGVGERLDEGFGEVTFCRTLHCELAGES